MAKKYTLNDLGKLLEKLSEDSGQTKKKVEDTNKKKDTIMSVTTANQDKIVEVCVAA